MKIQVEHVSGAPTFCHHCNRQLMRAPGKGLGLFYAVHLTHKAAGYTVRMHDTCARLVLRDETAYRIPWQGGLTMPRSSSAQKPLAGERHLPENLNHCARTAEIEPSSSVVQSLNGQPEVRARERQALRAFSCLGASGGAAANQSMPIHRGTGKQIGLRTLRSEPRSLLARDCRREFGQVVRGRVAGMNRYLMGALGCKAG